MQTGKITRFPVVLVGVDYWSGLIDWLRDTVLADGKVSEKDFDMFVVTDDIDEAVALMVAARDGERDAVMWFFAILLVLLMGAVAVVAAGRGQPMSEAYDDRPDPVLPVGEIRGDDIRRARFSLAVRGYRMSEVDALLDRLARQLDVPPSETDHGPDQRVHGEDDSL